MAEYSSITAAPDIQICTIAGRYTDDVCSPTVILSGEALSSTIAGTAKLSFGFSVFSLYRKYSTLPSAPLLPPNKLNTDIGLGIFTGHTKLIATNAHRTHIYFLGTFLKKILRKTTAITRIPAERLIFSIFVKISYISSALPVFINHFLNLIYIPTA